MDEDYTLKSGSEIPSSLVTKLREIEGLIASIIYGSFARGGVSRDSDIDILNIYEDEESLEKGGRHTTGLGRKIDTDRILQFNDVTLQDIKEDEGRSILTSALHEGEILFIKKPLGLSASELPPKDPFQIIAYDTSNCSNKRVSKLHYQLYGKKGRKKKGIIGSSNTCWKISDSTLLVDKNSAVDIKKALDEIEADYKVWDVWL